MLTSEGARTMEQDDTNHKMASTATSMGPDGAETMTDTDVDMEMEMEEADMTQWTEAEFEEKCTYIVKDTACEAGPDGDVAMTMTRAEASLPRNLVSKQRADTKEVRLKHRHSHRPLLADRKTFSPVLTFQTRSGRESHLYINRSMQTLSNVYLPGSVRVAMQVVGVCSREYIPKGTRFGPLVGEIYTADSVPKDANRKYFWRIFVDGEFHHFVDGLDEARSNWMRYVNPAKLAAEQNLAACQNGMEIYFYTVKPIPAGAELLVWYCHDFARRLRYPPSGEVMMQKLSEFNNFF
ncbi:hypothetical protein GOODEAATRI_014503 [Goodea atripinnis]|uniref:SET domain-containing protein n=1 Tax=Goodea atripinnis TaxID=208336 RepID=A0ABV0NUN3_9TELE